MFCFSQITQGVADCDGAANALLGDVECDMKVEQMLLNHSEDTISVSPEAMQFDYSTSNFQPKVYIQDLFAINSAADCLIPSSDDNAAPVVETSKTIALDDAVPSTSGQNQFKTSCTGKRLQNGRVACRICAKVFSNSFSRNRHMERFHNKASTIVKK